LPTLFSFWFPLKRLSQITWRLHSMRKEPQSRYSYRTVPAIATLSACLVFRPWVKDIRWPRNRWSCLIVARGTTLIAVLRSCSVASGNGWQSLAMSVENSVVRWSIVLFLFLKCQLKRTVARDFWRLFFFFNRTYLGPCSVP
jgi:hypothetical protein